MSTSNEEIQQIIQNMMQPAKPQINFLQQIANGLAGSMAVVASPHPGDMLNAQIQQRVQDQKQEEDRQNKIKEIVGRLQINDVIEKQKEQRQQGYAQTAFERQAGLEKELSGNKIKSEEKIAGNRITAEEGMQQKRLDAEKSLAEFNVNAQADMQLLNQQHQTDLEKMRLSGEAAARKMSAVLANGLPIALNGYMTPEASYKMVSDMLDGKVPDANATKALNNAVKAKEASERAFELKKAYAMHPRVTDPQSTIMKFVETFARSEKTMWIKNPQTGERKMMDYVTAGITQDPIVPKGWSFDGMADYHDKAKQAMDIVGPYMKGFAPADRSVSGPADQVNNAKLDAYIQAEIQAKTPAYKIVESLNDPAFQQAQGLSSVMISQALKRNGVDLNAQKPSSVEAESFNRAPIGKATKAVVDFLNQSASSMNEATKESPFMQGSIGPKGEQRKIISGLKQRIDVTNHELENPTASSNRRAELKATLKDLEDRLQYAREQFSKPE